MKVMKRRCYNIQTELRQVDPPLLVKLGSLAQDFDAWIKSVLNTYT